MLTIIFHLPWLLLTGRFNPNKSRIWSQSHKRCVYWFVWFRCHFVNRMRKPAPYRMFIGSCSVSGNECDWANSNNIQKRSPWPLKRTRVAHFCERSISIISIPGFHQPICLGMLDRKCLRMVGSGYLWARVGYSSWTSLKMFPTDLTRKFNAVSFPRGVPTKVRGRMPGALRQVC